MSPAVAILVLTAALLHASWNAFLRFGTDRLWTITIMNLASVAAALPFLFIVPLPDQAAWGYIFSSAALQAAYIFLLVAAYRHGELGQVYPVIRGSAPLLVTLGGFLLAGERLAPHQLAGVLLIAAGIMSLSLGRSRTGLSSLLFALAAGAFIAVYTTVDAIGVRLSGNSASYIAWVVTLHGSLLVGSVALLRGGLALDVRSAEFRKAFGGGVLALMSYAAVIAAFALAPAGPVAALRETSVVFALLIGWLFLGETLTLRRAMACIVVVVGAACLAYRP